MQIVHYPHPALRWESSDVQRIDLALRRTVRTMFELMYASKGIGLAANQVGLPLRFFVVNLQGEPSTPEDELVFINPVLRRPKGVVVGEEGCLSLPGLYADLSRHEEVTVEAFDLAGQPFSLRAKDLAARVVQHEYDHLDGVLFIDRLDDEERAKLGSKVAEMAADYTRDSSAGRIPDESALRQQLKTVATAGAVPEDFV